MVLGTYQVEIHSDYSVILSHGTVRCLQQTVWTAFVIPGQDLPGIHPDMLVLDTSMYDEPNHTQLRGIEPVIPWLPPKNISMPDGMMRAVPHCDGSSPGWIRSNQRSNDRD
jgi:hypothetical protein